jgi:sugar phosphate isomerase/epimerase
MKMFSDRLHNIHIRDEAPDDANPGKNKMVPLGEGIYDYRPVFATLREIGYTGMVTLEMVVPYDDPLTMLQKSIVNLKEIMRSV